MRWRRLLRGKAVALAVSATALAPRPADAQWLLVPMDREQTDHLRAYGLTYWVLDSGRTAEWLLNYRSGSFLLPDQPSIRREAALRGVTVMETSAGDIARIRGVASESAVGTLLERALLKCT